MQISVLTIRHRGTHKDFEDPNPALKTAHPLLAGVALAPLSPWASGSSFIMGGWLYLQRILSIKHGVWSIASLLLRVERSCQGSLRTVSLQGQSPRFLSPGDVLKATQLAAGKSRTSSSLYWAVWQPQKGYCQTRFPWGWELKSAVTFLVNFTLDVICIKIHLKVYPLPIHCPYCMA